MNPPPRHIRVHVQPDEKPLDVAEDVWSQPGEMLDHSGGERCGLAYGDAEVVTLIGRFIGGGVPGRLTIRSIFAYAF